MSITKSEKLKLMRESERMKAKELADFVGLNYVTYHNYESGKANMSLESAIKIFGHPRFYKYQDWFMYDRTDPAKGQIAPALAHYMPDESTSSR